MIGLFLAWPIKMSVAIALWGDLHWLYETSLSMGKGLTEDTLEKRSRALARGSLQGEDGDRGKGTDDQGD